ncbi:MAG: TetR/AcrR family transcriptional regulator C-terminal domain-containing protein [Leifsonia sp.]
MAEVDRPARRAGRPRTTVLTRDLIAHAALRLLDESGADGFTMARLAQALRVRPSALYNHVDGKEDVIAAVRELVSDRIDVDVFATEPWDAAMLAWARSYRVAFAAHPPTIALLATLPLTGALRTMHMYDTVVAALVRAGWPEPEVLPMIVAVESFILGSALDAIAPADMFDPAGADDAVPAFASAYRARSTALGDTPPADAAFEIGLRALLDGLRDRYARLHTGATFASQAPSS